LAINSVFGVSVDDTIAHFKKARFFQVNLRKNNNKIAEKLNEKKPEKKLN